MIRRILQQSFPSVKSNTRLSRCFCTSYQPKNQSEELNIGQPTPHTHPHLFGGQTECTPCITHEEYKTRRSKLMQRLSEQHSLRDFDRHIVVLTANELKIMSNDIPYPFHQDVDFLYLTGLNEPNAIAVLELAPPNEMDFLLFVQPKDPKRELWDGAVAGERAAVDYFNADEAFPLSSFTSVFRDRFKDRKSCIWIKKGKDTNKKNANEISKTFQSNRFSSCSIEDVRMHVQRMRVQKSFAEAKMLQASAAIGSRAFQEVIRQTRPGDSEALPHAVLESQCRALGAQYLSFPPVVAGGNRANTLHYINNDQILNDGDLVLMDGGCVYHGYASDITRTWPVNGHFSKPQARLYDIVLRVLKECTTRCDGKTSMNSLHGIMLKLLGQELQQIGLIDSKITKDAELQRAAGNFCPHHLGHYLGMDTHDCPLIHRGLALTSGMVFTLEPGVYIPESATDVPREYRGIGIRIEDDVLMTEDGPLVLTRDLPKEIEDIENLIASGR
ncbi:xaa-Pro aminopeptidase 3-like [Clytia hemisphaerica]